MRDQEAVGVCFELGDTADDGVEDEADGEGDGDGGVDYGDCNCRGGGGDV